MLFLTTKGREALASNDGSFQITQFALSDDEIDYTLYNPSHPIWFCILWWSNCKPTIIRSFSFGKPNNEI